MSAILYWQGRLIERQPIWHAPLRIEGDVIRSHRKENDTWPHAICRSAMYADYLEWFKRVYLPPFEGQPYYANSPDRLPEPADELNFYVTLSPWVYLLGKKAHVRMRNVSHRVCVEGRWIETKASRYFVRLCEWEDHVAAFELKTGIRLGIPPPLFDSGRAKTVAEAGLRYSTRYVGSPADA